MRSSDLSVISQTKPQVMSRAFSSGTANKLTQMMEAVVTKENPNLAIDGVQVAAKTGTAQIGDGNTSIDGWVVGFARRTIRRSLLPWWCTMWICMARSRRVRL